MKKWAFFLVIIFFLFSGFTYFQQDGMSGEVDRACDLLMGNIARLTGLEERVAALYRANTRTDSDIDEFRKVIINTGSLDYSQKLSEQLVKKSIYSLEKIDFKNQKAKNYFSGIADYIIERQL